MTGYANRQSDEVESLVPVGSTPTSVTDNLIPWSNGEDAWATSRKVMVRFHPGSLTKHGRLVQREDAWLATRRSGFDSPAGPLKVMGSWSNGTTPPWRGGNPSSILGGSTHLRKVAGDGSPGRFAKPCGFTAMWVQIPRLPLWLDGETEIMRRF